jgi:hypothetical protein
MEHIHRQLEARTYLAANGRPAENPLWTNLDTDWGKIHFLLRQAERDGKIDELLSSHIPAYPRLSTMARLLGLHYLRTIAIFPCQLALRMLRPLILRAGNRQERVNLSLVTSGRGLAHRLVHCEGKLTDYEERLTALEERLTAQQVEQRGSDLRVAAYHRRAA